jgi:hypothetical protein
MQDRLNFLPFYPLVEKSELIGSQDHHSKRICFINSNYIFKPWINILNTETYDFLTQTSKKPTEDIYGINVTNLGIL